MPLPVSDDLAAVRGVRGERTPVQSPGPLSPRLQVPVLRRSDQEDWLPGPGPVLGNAEAKKAVDVIPAQLDHRGPGLQVEGEDGGEEEDQQGQGEGEEGVVGDHDEGWRKAGARVSPVLSVP